MKADFLFDTNQIYGVPKDFRLRVLRGQKFRVVLHAEDASEELVRVLSDKDQVLEVTETDGSETVKLEALKVGKSEFRVEDAHDRTKPHYWINIEVYSSTEAMQAHFEYEDPVIK